MSRVVLAVSPAPPQLWAATLEQDPHATIMQTPAWARLVATMTRSRDASRVYEDEDGRRLVLPLLRRRLGPGLATQGAYPHGYGLGGLIATGGVRPADAAAVLRDLRENRALSTRITANFDVAAVWAAAAGPGVRALTRRVEVLDLDGGADAVWSRRYRSSTRRAVRRAEGAGLVVERDTTGRLVDEFYRIYLDWTATRARRQHLPQPMAAALARRYEPRAKFEVASALLGDACRFWLARLDGRPVAALVTLVHGRYAFFWRGYSDQALAGPTRANNLLQHLAIRDAIDSGCRFYGMGESGGVADLQRFKQSFGATPAATADLRIERLPLSRVENAADRARTAVLEQLGRLPLPGPGRAGTP